MGDLLVGVNDQVVVDSLEKRHRLGSTQRAGLHPHNGLADTRLASHQGTQNVDLVTLGHCNEQLGLSETRLSQHFGVSTATTEDLDVQLGLDPADAFTTDFDDRHVVSLGTETVGYVGADLAGTYHDDSHLAIIAHRRTQGVACPSNRPVQLINPRLEGGSPGLGLRPDHAHLGHQYVERNVPFSGCERVNNLEVVAEANEQGTRGTVGDQTGKGPVIEAGTVA